MHSDTIARLHFDNVHTSSKTTDIDFSQLALCACCNEGFTIYIGNNNIFASIRMGNIYRFTGRVREYFDMIGLTFSYQGFDNYGNLGFVGTPMGIGNTYRIIAGTKIPKAHTGRII